MNSLLLWERGELELEEPSLVGPSFAVRTLLMKRRTRNIALALQPPTSTTTSNTVVCGSVCGQCEGTRHSRLLESSG